MSTDARLQLSTNTKSTKKKVKTMHSNKRKKSGDKAATPEWARPSKADIDLLCDFYAEDFERFGYVPEQKKPVVAKPVLPEAYTQAREEELARQASFSFRWSNRFRRWRAKL